jgi:hypothetical protein
MVLERKNLTPFSKIPQKFLEKFYLRYCPPYFDLKNGGYIRGDTGGGGYTPDSQGDPQDPSHYIAWQY